MWGFLLENRFVIRPCHYGENLTHGLCPGSPRNSFQRFELDSLRGVAGRIALCDLGVTGITASLEEYDFSGLISQGARDTCILPVKLSLVHRTPQSIPGRRSALRTQGVLWRVVERRRCSSSRSFLTLLEKWTRCGVSIFYSQELQNPQARKQ